MKVIDILIVEDEIILAKDIEQMLFRNNYKKVRIATNYRKVEGLINEAKPDLILCDINLRGKIDGVDLMTMINEKNIIPFIFITAYSDNETLSRIAKLKPLAFISKPFSEKQLISNIDLFYNSKLEKKSTLLSSREMLILKHLSQGKKSSEIADLLNISVYTVRTHRTNILKKFSCNNTSELIFLASKQGLL